MTSNLPITDIDKVADIAYAKKNRKAKAEAMAKSISPWLHRLYDAYMERGRFPILPYVIGDYYQDPKDKETAIVLAMLIVSLTGSDAALKDMDNLRVLMGQHPYHEFFVRRQFALLSTGAEMERQLGSYASMRYWQIAKTIDHLWHVCDDMGNSIGEVFLHETAKGMSPLTAISSMVDVQYVKAADYRQKLLLLALCTGYGIGVGLWHFEGVENKLSCPATGRVKNMANIIMPQSSVYGFTVDEVALIFGFRPIDLWYLQHAYDELAMRNIDECKKYKRRYHSQYKHCSCKAMDRYQLKLMEPKIDFG